MIMMDEKLMMRDLINVDSNCSCFLLVIFFKIEKVAGFPVQNDLLFLLQNLDMEKVGEESPSLNSLQTHLLVPFGCPNHKDFY